MDVRPGDPGPEAVGTGVDTSVPHSARIWNYWLGGTDNFEVDRVAGDAWVARDPGIVDLARAQRAFLGRVVRHLAHDAGVRQFLDVGSGLPTTDNTHQVAQRAAADARVVYVDNDPLVLAHARALLAGAPEGATSYVHADLRDTARVLAEAGRTLDLSRPTALMFLGVLGHFADFDEARTLVRTLVDALAPGSFLVVADGGDEDPAQVEAAEEYAATGAVAYHIRPYRDVVRLFDGLELVEPGFVAVEDWRPEPRAAAPADGAKVNLYGGVARKGRE